MPLYCINLLITKYIFVVALNLYAVHFICYPQTHKSLKLTKFNRKNFQRLVNCHILNKTELRFSVVYVKN